MRGKMPGRVLVRAAAWKTLALLTTGAHTDYRLGASRCRRGTIYRLLCKAFGWKRTEDAASGYDAIDQQGTRYLIKAPHRPNRQSRQLSAIRNLDYLPFDFLAGLLVDENFRVVRAALVPVH
jgi:hypothetical protein